MVNESFFLTILQNSNIKQNFVEGEKETRN